MFLCHIQSAWGGIHPRWVIISTSHAVKFNTFFVLTLSPNYCSCCNRKNMRGHVSEKHESQRMRKTAGRQQASQSNYDIKDDFHCVSLAYIGFRRSSFSHGHEQGKKYPFMIRHKSNQHHRHRSDCKWRLIHQIRGQISHQEGESEDLIHFFLSMSHEG